MRPLFYSMVSIEAERFRCMCSGWIAHLHFIQDTGDYILLVCQYYFSLFLFTNITSLFSVDEWLNSLTVTSAQLVVLLMFSCCIWQLKFITYTGLDLKILLYSFNWTFIICGTPWNECENVRYLQYMASSYEVHTQNLELSLLISHFGDVGHAFLGFITLSLYESDKFQSCCLWWVDAASKLYAYLHVDSKMRFGACTWIGCLMGLSILFTLVCHCICF